MAKTKRALKLEKAIAWARENNLPELQGSEKQIAWAEQIRYEGYLGFIQFHPEHGANYIEILCYDLPENRSAKKYIEDHQEAIKNARMNIWAMVHGYRG